ncbi:hypothetical protein [Muricoccus nepalensis]|uniref:hypothetical protein n=1 Tax=Muricoccus nepalensis TaxID=1854500 RepID=UPI00112CBB8D|nr:hypothetical protein [Roseomonas nepalensis]
MKRRRFADEQIIGGIAGAGGGVEDGGSLSQEWVYSGNLLCRKAKYGGLGVPEAKRLRTLEDENGRLKRLVAEATLDDAVLKDLAAKKY